MTIDLHRDPSLSESAAFALCGSREAELRLPSSSDGVRYLEIRNLPTDNPVRAIELMEESLAPGGRFPPQHQRRSRRRITSKPALFYTVYWEADHTPQAERELIDQSLLFVSAHDRHALIVGRDDYPPRTHVLINAVDPVSRRLGIRPQPYFELMRWHLSTEPDPQAAESLARGSGATTIDSLRRQDLRLLDLPPQFEEAIRGVPGYNMDSATLHMVWRAGPSTFHTAEFIDTVHAEISEIEAASRRYRSVPLDPEVIHRILNHKRDTRRRLVLGAYLGKLLEHNDSFQANVLSNLDAALSDPFDRSLFNLHTLTDPSQGLICDFYPKKHKREWCAAFKGDPCDLPDDLIGYAIQIQPHPPSPPWYARITEIALRTADRLIVKTAPRDYISLYSNGWRTVV